MTFHSEYKSYKAGSALNTIRTLIPYVDIAHHDEFSHFRLKHVYILTDIILCKMYGRAYDYSTLTERVCLPNLKKKLSLTFVEVERPRLALS